jgi:hypothetical protein
LLRPSSSRWGGPTRLGDVEQDDDVPAERQAEVVAAVVANLGPLRAAYLHPGSRAPGAPVWKRIGRAAAAGDREARGAFCPRCGLRAAAGPLPFRALAPDARPRPLDRSSLTLAEWTLDTATVAASATVSRTTRSEGTTACPICTTGISRAWGGPLSAFVADWMDLAAGDCV